MTIDVTYLFELCQAQPALLLLLVPICALFASITSRWL